MSDFEKAVKVVLSNESGKLNPDDNGRGPSKWGVTLETAREFWPACAPADIEAMDEQKAACFYRVAFWGLYRIGLIENQELATQVLDLAVNMGPIAIKLLQRSVGTEDDGIMGPHTAAAANENPGAAMSGLKWRAAQYYRDLASVNPAKYGKDLPGWLHRLTLIKMAA